MEETRSDYNQEQRQFVDKYTDIACIIFAVFVLWFFYLQFVFSEWQYGLVPFYKYYELREMTGTVALIINLSIVTSGILLMLKGVYDKNERYQAR